MNILALIRAIIREPTQTMQAIEKRANLRQAASIVGAAGVISGIIQLMTFSEPHALGAALIVLHALVGRLAMWMVLSIVLYVCGRWMFGGQGRFRTVAVGVGAAYVPLLLSSIAAGVLFHIQTGFDLLFGILFLGWFAILLTILTREVLGLTTGRILALLGLMVMAALPLYFYSALTRVLIVPLVIDAPTGIVVLPGDGRMPVALRLTASAAWQEGALPPTAPNLVGNGGFEQTTLSKDDKFVVPTEWQAQRGFWPCVLSCQKKVVHDGEYAGLIRRDGPPSARMKGWLQLVPGMEPGQEVYLSCWLRTEDATAATTLVAFFRQKEEKPAPQGPNAARGKSAAEAVDSGPVAAGHAKATAPAQMQVVPASIDACRGDWVRGTGDWQNVRVKATVPKNATVAMVGVYLWGGGTVWVDDVALYQPGAKDAASAPPAGGADAGKKTPAAKAGEAADVKRSPEAESP